MEFLNGLEAQLLELLAGEVCQQAGWLFTVQAAVRVFVCLLVFFCPLSLLKANFLGKESKKDPGLGQYVSYSFVYVDFGGWPWGLSKRSFC